MTKDQFNKLRKTFNDYKQGKARLDKRIKDDEDWWKLRNSFEESRFFYTPNDGSNQFHANTGWLHNIIVNKHADAVDNYPSPVILPREPGDREEARTLSEIIPCILEQNDFEDVWSDVMWQKLKTGTGVYKIIWDQSKLNGLGDISISRVDLLNLFWEPGITDIQKSRYIFQTSTDSIENLEALYPELKGKIKTRPDQSSKFRTEDYVSDDGKATVTEVYWKETVRGKQILSYCKYCGDTLLYETKGKSLYDHGLYPFIFDVLFPVEGSPCGYGFVDLSSNTQTAIDLLMTSFVRNTMVSTMPRYFSRIDGAVSEEEFLDLTKPIIHVNGNLGDDSLKPVSSSGIPNNVVNVYDRLVEEIRQNSGNTETATGTVSSGITAASAIVALQEASGKGSRDSVKGSYRAFTRVVSMCIELQRQFYDFPRMFRITEEIPEDDEAFVDYSNEGLKAKPVISEYGLELGYRLPVFDIKVEAQKKDAYSQIKQNEIALQFYKLGFFVPENAAAALMCIDMMEFDSKDQLMAKIAENAEAFTAAAEKQNKQTKEKA